uniref:tRNA pseudouridine synthase n=1 Tax=Ciona savignyi TaxID=51511 RepID=H2YEI4_CIOSA
LNELTKEDLIRLTLNFQGKYRQILNKSIQSNSKLQTLREKLQPKKKRKVRSVNFDSFMFRRIALKIAYLGWDYEGLQENENLDDTIERILRVALRGVRLVPPDCDVYFSRCGRTDKEVSAFSQVIVVNVRSKLSAGPESNMENNRLEDTQTIEVANETEYDYPVMLNRVLPAEINVIAWAPIEDEQFSARRHCLGREYRYYFHQGNANVSAMNDAAKRFCGLHDFRNFGKVNVVNCVNYVRRIEHFDIMSPLPSDNLTNPYQICYARIIGSGFIYHQVRSMMAVLYLIGIGLENSDVITQLLDIETHPKKPWFGLVKPQSLVLFDSLYDNIQWRVSETSAVRFLENIQSYWSDLDLKSRLTLELVKLTENDETIRVETENGTTTTYKDIADSLCKNLNHGVNKKLLTDCFKLKREGYKKLLDRPAGKTLGEHLEHAVRKKR